MRNPEFVWLPEEQVYGVLVSLGAYYSLISYTKGGLDYQVIMSNDEFEYFGENEIDDDTD